eukprot:1963413-Pyramimonas_sp.AAC.1
MSGPICAQSFQLRLGQLPRLLAGRYCGIRAASWHLERRSLMVAHAHVAAVATAVAAPAPAAVAVGQVALEL